jgi:hypothetical protein
MIATLAGAQNPATFGSGTLPESQDQSSMKMLPPAEIARIDLGKSHAVVFEKSATGLVSVLEIGSEADESLVTEEMLEAGVGAIWSELSREPVPLALVDETKNLPKANMEYRMSQENLEDELHVNSPVQKNTSEQNWFRDTFCTGRTRYEHCVQAWDWAYSVSEPSPKYTAVGWVGSEGSRNADLKTYFWKCKQILFWKDCSWSLMHHDVVSPGWWVKRAWPLQNESFSWKAELNGAGANTQISLLSNWDRCTLSAPDVLLCPVRD